MTQTAIEQPVASVIPGVPAVPTAEQDTFQTGKILTIVSGHFTHDTYTAFLAPLLPLLIEKLGMTLTQAGALQVFMQLPGLGNVAIGYVADKLNLRYFVIFAPAVTATLMSAMGLMSSYLSLAILLFAAGVSVSAFHVPAPAMIGQVSGRRVGRGMSLFMAGGELGRTVGPLLVVWGITTWGLDGIWRLAIFGWVASAVLYWRLRHISAQSGRQRTPFRAVLPRLRRLFVPLSGLMFLQSFVVTGLSVFLVVLLEGRGYGLGQSSQALALWSFAGVAGALTGGTVSDRIGRKRTIILATVLASLLLLAFLSALGAPGLPHNTLSFWAFQGAVAVLTPDSPLILPVLILLGFTSLSVTPVIQAIVQEQVPDSRATANGIFMLLAFLLRSFGTLLIGIMGDSIGLSNAFVVCAVAGVAAVPLVLALPDLKR